MKTDLSSYNNAWYHPGNKVKRLLWYFTNVLFFINPLNPSSKLKIILLKWFGARVGSNVMIKPGVNIKHPWFLSLGNHIWIGEKVWIDNLTEVRIENHVCISQGAMLLCGNHNYKITSFDLILGKITLKEGVWIGAKSTVCPGVTVQTHAVLTAGSIATKDLEAYQIYQGNPAIKTKKRTIN
ncbi:WcaF family extracellular polysaccharide biosynthesis acetyltransferase [Tamlana sp. 2_MG-2023]|uniref:WcaF family extracellular polysaccharide biosynthesis acetyltransferase n=1 Tax=unclassified Tamlana TaxID=2614803 RepID=UPI0026E4587E|nr:MULTISPECIES: WcaF family extracellular polysaccharide biosynthesis acetyltransferase [unclassified Tamlana]MDO6760254.1 WcaF family extracellular polysaccharide biosynthesis acetyltransferase [Tamlana sp. 2_MG-2023]MDO6790048.1 WcaF family extracellular polysaccharide biosynthesis acetyltransferase [Tamlana sp. 1_MG-2023]